MSALAVTEMAAALSLPFERGADLRELPWAAGATAARATVAGYDYAEHFARHGSLPDPRHVVATLHDVTVDTTVTIEYEVVTPGPPFTGETTVTFPAGAPAGTSMRVDLGPLEGPSARLRTIEEHPVPEGSGAVTDRWALAALLGNLAKLLWVVSGERDVLRGQLRSVHSQRRLGSGRGRTLDLIGYDLGVQRFPPLPYGFDGGAIALYHLDDPPGLPVADAMGNYGATAHPGTATPAVATAAGRFGRGLAFRGPAAEVAVPHHGDFALPAPAPLTAECFVQPDDVAQEGDVLSKIADTTAANASGWALTVGRFDRGIARNVRFLVADGTRRVEVFADVPLALGRFTHVAGVVDRAAGEVRLYIDGGLRAAAPAAALAALTSTASLRIGRAGAASFSGVVDEVRLSSVARSAFAPALGEGDDSYRRRLRIFRRWALPTPANLQAALNDVVDEIGGDPEPFVVDDTDATIVEGAARLRVTAASLPRGESIAGDGTRRIEQPAVCGTPADEGEAFDPELLVRHANAQVAYTAAPARTLAGGEAAPDPHRMHQAAAAALDRLVAKLPGGSPRVTVDGAFDRRGEGVRPVGRALLLRTSTDPGALAALAHEAGFDWVARRADDTVVAAVAAGTPVAIARTGAGTATAAPGCDLLTGQTLELRVDPDLPAGTQYRWSTVACGAGRGTIASPPAGGSGGTARTATVTAAAPGDLAVEVEVRRGPRVLVGNLRLRVGISDLDDNTSIGGDGRTGADESVAGEPADAPFDPAYLVTLSDARMTYPAPANGRRVQASVAAKLAGLLDSAAGAADGMEIVSAYEPGGTGLETVGRVVTIRRGTATAGIGRLGALAHAAGFAWVRRSGTDLRVAERAGALIGVTGPESVAEGASARFSLSPEAVPARGCLAGQRLWVTSAGTDTLSGIDRAGGRFERVVKVGAGPVAVAASRSGGQVFTADALSRTLTVVDAAGGSVTGTVALPGEPVAIAHHRALDRLYAIVRGPDRVVEIDTAPATPAIGRTFALPAGEGPIAIAVHPVRNEVWIAMESAKRLAVVDVPATGALSAIGSVPLPAPPADVALSAARAYAALPSTQQLAVADTATRTLTSAPTLGARPHRVAVSPDEASVYVADAGDARLYIRRPDGAPAPAAHAFTGLVPSSVVAAADRVFVVKRPDAAVTGSAAQIAVFDVAGADTIAHWPVGTGHGERLAWSLQQVGGAHARLASTTAPRVDVQGDQAGDVVVRAVMTWPERTPPYTFAVRLNPTLAATSAVITKDRYDLVMNVLNAFHPIGVEVDTRAIRERVRELRLDLLDVFPNYTYPDFRSRGRKPVQFTLGEE